MAVLREDKQAAAIDPVYFPICARLLQPGEPPGSREPVLDIFVLVILTADHTGRHQDDANRNRAFHSVSRPLNIKSSGKTFADAFPILPILCLILL